MKHQNVSKGNMWLIGGVVIIIIALLLGVQFFSGSEEAVAGEAFITSLCTRGPSCGINHILSASSCPQPVVDAVGSGCYVCSLNSEILRKAKCVEGYSLAGWVDNYYSCSKTGSEERRWPPTNPCPAGFTFDEEHSIRNYVYRCNLPRVPMDLKAQPKICNKCGTDLRGISARSDKIFGTIGDVWCS